MRGLIGTIVTIVLALVAIWALAQVADFAISATVWGIAVLVAAVLVVMALVSRRPAI